MGTSPSSLACPAIALMQVRALPVLRVSVSAPQEGLPAQHKKDASDVQDSAHQLAVFVDAPAKDDGLDGRPLHVVGQGAAEVAHAAGLLQQALLRGRRACGVPAQTSQMCGRRRCSNQTEWQCQGCGLFA